MRLLKQTDGIDVINFDVVTGRQTGRHGRLLPSTVRCLICGPSNCGKTNLLLSLLIHENGLKFENVYVYSKSLYQPKYQFLDQVLSSVPSVQYFPYKENDEIIEPSEALANSVFVFDDVACDKQDKIRRFFSMGRHKSVDSFYLCQSYTRVPKHLIRDNANLIILFKQDGTNLRNAFEDHVSTDMTFEQFKLMCSECWDGKYGFLVIDKDSDVDKGRYRKNFDNYICLWN